MLHMDDPDQLYAKRKDVKTGEKPGGGRNSLANPGSFKC